MRVYDIILKKKRGEELKGEEIRSLIAEYTGGKIPDYQMSALLMAICWRGMSEEETLALTNAIADSGDKIDLSDMGSVSADKHSTGGVGDKTTLIVAPIAAALGCKVAKMSGRGLGHTGGTVDKLKAIPGYQCTLPREEFIFTLKKTGIAVIEQSGELAPADKKLYALRDVTATVDSIPLIASSVMGKKLASGANSIVLDVKYGSGSFMKTAEEAEKLASLMVKIGKGSGRNTSAFISNMDAPLGSFVGNTLELKEAISTLKGEAGGELAEISTSLAAEMVSLTRGVGFERAKELAEEALKSGLAFEKFKEWISAQGGDLNYIENPNLFESAKFVYEIKADTDAYIKRMNAENIGLAAMELGAGRKTKDELIDFAAGVELLKKPGDRIKKGDTLARLYTDRENSRTAAEELFISSLELGKNKPEPIPIIHKIIR